MDPLNLRSLKSSCAGNRRLGIHTPERDGKELPPAPMLQPGRGFVFSCEPFYDRRILIDHRQYVLKEPLMRTLRQIGA